MKENYKGIFKISKTPNSDGKYEVSSTKDVEVINRNITSLTNGMFIWVNVIEDFICSYCYSLETLEGAPEKVGRDFDCSCCESLKNLKGAPEKVGENFICYTCKSLESLEGAPEKVGRNFICYTCKSLKTLKGAPKEVGKDFNCRLCKIKFTADDVKKVSNVKGEIMC